MLHIYEQTRYIGGWLAFYQLKGRGGASTPQQADGCYTKWCFYYRTYWKFWSQVLQ